MTPAAHARQIMLAIGGWAAEFRVMRFLLPLLLTATIVVAQDDAPIMEKPAAPQPVEAPAPKKNLREIWGLTEAQYRLVDPSRRRNGDTYKYFRAFHRGPHGNMLEHVPGGPRRPVSR